LNKITIGLDRSLFFLYIDNSYQYQGFVMGNSNVKVCKGPNCKAWSSYQIARELEKSLNVYGLSDIKVCRVACMDACHGGVSIKVDSSKKILKVKEKEDVLTILGVRTSIAC
jgi:NADH:ubiquinone oxidoreductase subunit E